MSSKHNIVIYCVCCPVVYYVYHWVIKTNIFLYHAIPPLYGGRTEYYKIDCEVFDMVIYGKEVNNKNRNAVLIAVLLGWCGGYRFYKRQYALGILYLFTCGLFFVGWRCSCAVRFAVRFAVLCCFSRYNIRLAANLSP